MKELRSAFRQLQNKIEQGLVLKSNNPVPTWLGGESLLLPVECSDAVSQGIEGQVSYAMTTHYGNGSWSSHVACLLPLNGLVNDNLGPTIVSGVATRYLNREKTESLFERDQVTPLLQALDYRGPVSVLLNSEHKKLHVIAGAPWGGIFPLLTTLRKSAKLEQYLRDPAKAPFHETWCVALVVSKFPFPHPGFGNENTLISGLDENLIAYTFPCVELGKVIGREKEANVCLRDGLVAVVTGWHEKFLSKAVEYAELTAKRISFKDKQFRTDGYKQFSSAWEKVKWVYQ